MDLYLHSLHQMLFAQNPIREGVMGMISTIRIAIGLPAKLKRAKSLQEMLENRLEFVRLQVDAPVAPQRHRFNVSR